MLNARARRGIAAVATAAPAVTEAATWARRTLGVVRLPFPASLNLLRALLWMHHCLLHSAETTRGRTLQDKSCHYCQTVCSVCGASTAANPTAAQSMHQLVPFA